MIRNRNLMQKFFEKFSLNYLKNSRGKISIFHLGSKRERMIQLLLPFTVSVFQILDRILVFMETNQGK